MQPEVWGKAASGGTLLSPNPDDALLRAGNAAENYNEGDDPRTTGGNQPDGTYRSADDPHGDETAIEDQMTSGGGSPRPGDDDAGGESTIGPMDQPSAAQARADARFERDIADGDADPPTLRVDTPQEVESQANELSAHDGVTVLSSKSGVDMGPPSSVGARMSTEDVACLAQEARPLRQQDRNEEALAVIERALAVAPDDARLWSDNSC
jgi:hypothetical protein